MWSRPCRRRQCCVVGFIANHNSPRNEHPDNAHESYQPDNGDESYHSDDGHLYSDQQDRGNRLHADAECHGDLANDRDRLDQLIAGGRVHAGVRR